MAEINLTQLREWCLITERPNPHHVELPTTHLLALIDTAEAAIEWATEENGYEVAGRSRRLRATLDRYV